MQNKSQIRINYFFLILPFTFLLNSCGAKFKSVNEFVDGYKKDLQETSSAFANDIFQSCLRRTNYIALTPSKFRRNITLDAKGSIPAVAASHDRHVFSPLFANLQMCINCITTKLTHRRKRSEEERRTNL